VAPRFATDAKLARAGGIAPSPVSSGNTNRHRLDRGSNRQINTPSTASPLPVCAATSRPRPTSPAKRAEGKTSTEAIRCLKRHLARRIWHLLQPPPATLSASIS
jgi:transposase